MMKFLFSTLLLKTAHNWIKLFRKNRLFRASPTTVTLLPQLDSDPERGHRIDRERRQYEYVRIADKMQVATSLQVKTARILPEKERYPLGMLIPKLLVIAALKLKTRKKKKLTSLAQLEKLYRVLGTPRILKTWKTDSEFVRQRLQGINPVWIKRCDDPASLLQDGLDRTAFDRLMRGYQARHPLYVVNYHRLLADIPVREGCFLAPAIAIFECRQDNLHPLGIQLWSPEQGAVWFQPDASPGWTLAKMFFNSADLFVHEALTHLLWTHLLIEHFWIAAVRNLSNKHPVRKFLAPHFHFTMHANANSNNILLGPDGIFAELFSAGLEGTVRLFEKGEELWTLEQTVLPELLKKNGVSDLPGYYYRDDALLIWNAISNYSKAYSALYYRQPADIQEDTELQAWSEELAQLFGPGKIPPIDTAEKLHLILTAILFNVVQHTYVGAVQYEYIAYPPAMPPTLHIPVPARQEDVREDDLVRALPGLDQIYTIIKATFAFSQQYTTLGYHLDDAGQAADVRAIIQDFQQELHAIETIIAERERERPKPYRISKPSAIANSVSA